MLPYLSSLHFHSLLPPFLVVSLFFHLSSLHSRLYFPFLSSILPSLFSFLFDYPIFLPFSSFICFFVPCSPVLIFPHPPFLPFFLTYSFLTLPLFSYFCLYPCHLSFILSLCPCFPLSSFFAPFSLSLSPPQTFLPSSPSSLNQIGSQWWDVRTGVMLEPVKSWNTVLMVTRLNGK